jgi:hypothetical protein
MGIGLYSEFPTVGIGATLVAGFTPSHPLQFGFPIVSANGSLHEPDPHPACGHPLPSDGRGAGGEGSFACRFMVPMRMQKQMEATHEPTQLSISNFQFSIAAQLGIGN